MITIKHNYINFKCLYEFQAVMLRAALRSVFGKDSVDPYHESKRTVRVYVTKVNKKEK